MTYKEYEKAVFDWLIKKNQQDPTFTFSLRRKGSKGAESNYFIGTEVSNYFGTTFWVIPVTYPGSSSDLFDLIFAFSKSGKLCYRFEITQTRSPEGEQNKAALALVKALKHEFKPAFGYNYIESAETNKMEWATIRGKKAEYEEITELFEDLEEDISKIIPIVNDNISKIKTTFPSFTAHRITPEEFASFREKMDSRVEKYSKSNVPTEEKPTAKEEKTIVSQDADTPKFPLNQILFGPPGTGKTFNSINRAVAIVEQKEVAGVEKEERSEVKKRFDAYLKTGQIVFTTFHQSMSYEDFIEGIKPLKPGPEDTFVKYEVESGIFKKICQNAKTPNLNGFDEAYEALKEELSGIEYLTLKTPTGKEFSISLNSNDNLSLHTGANKEKQGTLTKENIQKQINGEEKFKGWEGYFKGVVECLTAKYHYSKSENKGEKNYVLIIDEINRGNVSQIFGELITLIEEDKRLSKEEALEVTLPYSKEKFGVPANVYLIGTMNTADRSVEALDAALRRRFSFEEMPPKPELIAAEGKLKAQTGVIEGIDVAALLKVMNKRIEKLLDKDHQIGHSYFMSVSSLEDLQSAFQNKIIPLLQEYFFGDYGKIGLVLGKGFVKKQEWDEKETSFADFDYENAGDFAEREVYELIDYTKQDLSFTLEIKKIRVEMDFLKAIKLLLNQEIG
jgi:5-methylcytosine-specific restriction enzyme B